MLSSSDCVTTTGDDCKILSFCASSVDISLLLLPTLCHYLFMEIIIDAIDTTSFKSCLVYCFHFSLHPETPFLSHISQCTNLLVFKIIHLCNIVLCFITTIREEVYFVLCEFVRALTVSDTDSLAF